MKFKISEYLTIVPYEDKYLVAQGVLARFLVMEKKLYEEALRNLNVESAPEIEKAKKDLLGIFAILPKEINEQKMIEDVYNSSLEKDKEKDFGHTLVLTLRCNFACIYCFETEKKVDMTKEIIDKALESLFKRAEKNKLETFQLLFSGGEALLFPEKIEYAVLKTRAFCQKKKIKPLFAITTNGSIFSQSMEKLFSIEKDLTRVQITLDGPKEIHDQRRMFKNGKGSYDIILQNISRWMRIAEEIRLRINVDKENASHVPRLLEELSGLKEENLKIWLVRVFEAYSKGAERKDKTLDWRDYEDLEKEYYSLARKLGLKIRGKYLPSFKPYCCPINIPNPWWIGPDGERYCCLCDMGDRSRSVGSVFKEEYDKTRVKGLCKYNLLNMKECLKCKHVFFCGGPCPAITRKGLPPSDLCGECFKWVLERNIQHFVS